MDMNQRLNDLLVISTRLTELLERENKALRARRVADVGPLVDDKAMLCRAYESRAVGLKENASDLPEADADLVERLRAAGERVQELVAENASLLKVAMDAHQNFISTVAQAVKECSGGPESYAPRGARRAQGVKPVRRPRAVSFNQTL